MTVGEKTADLIVEDQTIVEPKVVGTLSDVHVPQCRNYVRATGKSLCLPNNFGQSKVEIRRVAARSLIAETIPDIPAYPLHLS